MRTKNNWTGERKTILTKDDEETLSSKRMHVALKSQDKQAPRSVSGTLTVTEVSGWCVHSHVTNQNCSEKTNFCQLELNT